MDSPHHRVQPSANTCTVLVSTSVHELVSTRTAGSMKSQVSTSKCCCELPGDAAVALFVSFSGSCQGLAQICLPCIKKRHANTTSLRCLLLQDHHCKCQTESLLAARRLPSIVPSGSMVLQWFR
eukprot:GHUV01012031.1.p1 GENE.GHUV01012031.1~~GHUV01012031.1.p1  ORF type:complete len:124 (+),score=24.30 GHUV01012031.1:1496-1867(+)